MKMKIEKIFLSVQSVNIPLIKIANDESLPNVIVLHGYGGNKEEQLGLSYRIADYGFNTYTIDMRGHGENKLPLSIEIMDDLDNLINEIKKTPAPVITVGHSLGGRISLLSKADYRIGLSPALSQSFSEQTKTIIKNIRQHRVNPENAEINFDILSKLPPVELSFSKNDLIIYGSRDIPDIVQVCGELAKTNENVVEINNATHSDTFLLEQIFSEINKFIRRFIETV
jgi:hypothetical protein